MTPYHALRPCSYPGCPALVSGRGGRYCNEHLRIVRAQQDARRGTAAERGYDAAWRAVRARFLREHPVCARCGRPATTVHHMRRKRAGGSDDEDNLVALCASCHNAITMREDVGRG